MKSVLCICNTYAQLIIAMQLRKTLFDDCSVDVIITDHSKNADEVAGRLSKLEFFNSVYYIACKDYDYHRNMAEQCEFFFSAVGQKNTKKLKAISNVYNEMVYYNLTPTTLEVYSQLYSKNHELIVSRYEEGITSCMDSAESEEVKSNGLSLFSIVLKFRKLLNKKNLTDDITYFYCHYPVLYDGIGKAVEVPLIGQEMNDVISASFDICGQNISYKQKYIFFASVGDFEGEEPVGEVDTALKVAELVGKDNLIVKVHPRDRSGKFESSGLNVDRNSSVPWEAIQLNYDFSDHVFLTISSNSVFGVNVMMKKQAKVFFLYNTLDTKKNSLIHSSVEAIKNIMQYKDQIDLKNYLVVDEIKEILG